MTRERRITYRLLVIAMLLGTVLTWRSGSVMAGVLTVVAVFWFYLTYAMARLK